jgi:cytochrome c oxidase subunit IV
VADRFPIAQSLGLLFVFLVSLAGLAVFTGAARVWNPDVLTAEIRLQPLVLPSDVGLDPTAVAAALVTEMQEHADRDVALRLSLGQANSEKIAEVVVPRLVNSAVIGRMMQAVPALQTVLALPELKTVARVAVHNASAAPLEDVALTMPGLVRAERADGADAAVATTQTGLTALGLGTLAAGQTLDITAWLSVPLGEAGAATGQIALGAANDIDGAVIVHPTGSWMGEDLAVNLWARWLVAAILVALTIASAGLLVAIVVMHVRGSRPGRVRPS